MRRAVKRRSNCARTGVRSSSSSRPTAATAVGLVVHDEAGHAVVDHLGHRAAVERDHRRAAGHRLDHHQAERLRPVDREQQRVGARQECRLLASLISPMNSTHGLRAISGLISLS